MIQKLPTHEFTMEKCGDFTPAKIDQFVRGYKEKYTNYVTKPNFKDEYALLKDIIAPEKGTTQIKVSKPEYLGQAILDY